MSLDHGEALKLNGMKNKRSFYRTFELSVWGSLSLNIVIFSIEKSTPCFPVPDPLMLIWSPVIALRT
jgi:hypothetical protein